MRVLPVDQTLTVGEGETVLHAAQRNGWRWPTVCQGDCECGVCFMVVEEGAEHLTAKGEAETDRLRWGIGAKDPRSRLACQVRLHGEPVRVFRRGARPVPEDEASDGDGERGSADDHRGERG